MILPILLEDCEIPSLISDKKYADFRYNYQTGLSELLDVLRPSRAHEQTVSRREDSINEEIENCWKIYNGTRRVGKENQV